MRGMRRRGERIGGGARRKVRGRSGGRLLIVYRDDERGLLGKIYYHVVRDILVEKLEKLRIVRAAWEERGGVTSEGGGGHDGERKGKESVGLWK